MRDKMFAVAEEGIRSGELIPVEPSQLLYAALGSNVFYFLSAPMIHLITETDPLQPAALELRRKAAIEFLGQAFFMDRAHGARVAARVLAETPMPRRIEPPPGLPSPLNASGENLAINTSARQGEDS
jgi:TetR/AcrR family transcriptional regulator